MAIEKGKNKKAANGKERNRKWQVSRKKGTFAEPTNKIRYGDGVEIDGRFCESDCYLEYTNINFKI